MMKILVLFVVGLFSVGIVSAQESKPTNFPVPNTFSNSVNDLDNQKKNISVTNEDGEVFYKSSQEIEINLNDAIRLYKADQFAEAYLLISELAQWGIKDAQAILGDMFLKGEHVDKSTERGILWLGVAKQEPSQKAAAESFDYIYNQLSDEHKTYIDQQLNAHIEKFGSQAQNITCKRVSAVGSNLRSTKCTKASDTNSVLYPIP